MSEIELHGGKNQSKKDRDEIFFFKSEIESH